MLQRSDLSRLKIEIYGFQKSANSSQIDRKEKQNFEIENIFFFLLEKVSKWKLYKTARKRGIYAEIKKQNQAQVRPLSLSLSISLFSLSLSYFLPQPNPINHTLSSTNTCAPSYY